MSNNNRAKKQTIFISILSFPNLYWSSVMAVKPESEKGYFLAVDGVSRL